MTWKNSRILLAIASLFIATTAQAIDPPTEAELGIINAIPMDEAPKKLNATRADLEGRHYLSGDEANMQIFYERIKDIGGMYCGVGTDQAYLLMGWMKADFAVNCDYDPWVRWLHLAYVAFFEKAETYDDLRSYFLRKNVKKSRKYLREFYKDHPEAKKIERVFRNAQGKANRRLRRLKKWMTENKTPSFATDQAQYDHVRSMVRTGRFRPLLCNLLADTCLIGVGDASRKLNVPLRVLYTSNAEQYWPYSDQFRANIKAQNFDDKSVILRTLAAKNVNGDYAYNLQPGNNFKLWLEKDWVKRVKQITGKYYFKSGEDVPYIITDIDPEEAKKSRNKKRRR